MVNNRDVRFRWETYHGTEGNESHQGVRGKQTETDYERVAESLEFILVHACVDDKEERGWYCGAAREGVFDGGELGQQFGGEIRVGDVFIVRGEGIALQAEGTDPKLSANINLAARTHFRLHRCAFEHVTHQ